MSYTRYTILRKWRYSEGTRGNFNLFGAKFLNLIQNKLLVFTSCVKVLFLPWRGKSLYTTDQVSSVRNETLKNQKQPWVPTRLATHPTATGSYMYLLLSTISTSRRFFTKWQRTWHFYSLQPRAKHGGFIIRQWSSGSLLGGLRGGVGELGEGHCPRNHVGPGSITPSQPTWLRGGVISKSVAE